MIEFSLKVSVLPVFPSCQDVFIQEVMALYLTFALLAKVFFVACLQSVYQLEGNLSTDLLKIKAPNF